MEVPWNERQFELLSLTGPNVPLIKLKKPKTCSFFVWVTCTLNSILNAKGCFDRIYRYIAPYFWYHCMHLCKVTEKKPIQFISHKNIHLLCKNPQICSLILTLWKTQSCKQSFNVNIFTKWGEQHLTSVTWPGSNNNPSIKKITFVKLARRWNCLK